MNSLPKPNTQALSWFYGEYKKGTLILDPKYQRNPIWSLGQNCFLVDSIISGCPIPQVFLNIDSRRTGSNRETLYEVVDGQQRLRAILEYMDDKYELVKTTAKSYPVSDIYAPLIGKKYSQLPEGLQDTIWNYQLAVQELRGWNEQDIRALFRRLNYVVERLNKQEMRHSQYFGEFVAAVEKLSNDSFWDDIQFFSRKESQRMKDVEFISELFIIVIAGEQDGQKTIDKFYADFDVDFPKKNVHIAKFHRILESLFSISDTVKTTRLIKKADFYALFGAITRIYSDPKTVLDLRPAISKIKKFDRELRKPRSQLRGIYAKYSASVIEGPNKLSKRRDRIEILENLLRNSLNI